MVFLWDGVKGGGEGCLEGLRELIEFSCSLASAVVVGV